MIWNQLNYILKTRDTFEKTLLVFLLLSCKQSFQNTEHESFLKSFQYKTPFVSFISEVFNRIIFNKHTYFIMAAIALC